jgi:ElaB/YqjD/DUF883 family membrane-anchored ribosome-binding protein
MSEIQEDISPISVEEIPEFSSQSGPKSTEKSVTDEIDYYDAFDKYSELKRRYKKKIQREKNKIIKNKNLSKSEKKEKIKEIQIKCVNCSRKTGTIFSNKNREYIATCGGSDGDKCKLNIHLKKPTVIDIRKVLEEIKKEKNGLELQILSSKLDYIFGYINDEILEQKFTEYKGDLDLISENHNVLNDEQIQILDTNLRNIKMNEINNEIEKYIKENKKLIKEYRESEYKEKKYIVSAVENYINEILPKINEKTDIQYRERYLDINNDKVILIQNENLKTDYEYILEESEVISYKL